MKKIIFISILLYLIVMLGIVFYSGIVNAEEYWKDTEGNLSKRFSMCQCIEEGREVFPDLRDDQIEVECENRYIDYLMKKSEKSGKVEVGVFESCN